MRPILLAAALCLAAGPAWSATRWHQYTGKYEKPENPVTVVSSGYFGGNGTEWLAGGGFQADGHVVVGGTALGPRFDLPGGVEVRVLGRDAKAPGLDPSKLKDRKGRMRGTYAHENATGFVARLDPDLDGVVDCVRFPWRAGGITGCVVAEDGHVYVAGHGGPHLGNLGRGEELGGTEGSEPIFLAKLAPDLSEIVWLKAMPYKNRKRSPRLELGPDGGVLLTGYYYHAFDADGERTLLQDIPDKGRAWGANPATGGYAVGGDYNTGTGREPWRDPYLRTYTPDGELEWHLYSWNPRMIGTDQCRLVSDSSIRFIRYTADGEYMWMVGWSDGGNSCLNMQPYDFTKPIKSKGLGMSAWGINVSSLCYIMKMNVETCDVEAKTLWLAYLKNENKPNGIGIDNLVVAGDGSLVAAGGSASGLIQTGNNLHEGEPSIRKGKGPWAPGGDYVTVFEPDLSGLRFSSAINAAGAAEIRGGMAEKWGIATGAVGRQEKALVVCAAAERSGSKYMKGEEPAPEKNPLQDGFGGGLLDGYILILDL